MATSSNVVLFRAAVLARKAAMAYEGNGAGFRPLISSYWKARREYAEAAGISFAEAHKVIVIAASAE